LETISYILFYITAGGYLAATLVFIAYLVTHRDAVVTVARNILFAGFAAHTLTIIIRWVEAGGTPATTFHDSLMLFAWLTAAVYVVVYLKYKLSVLGAFVSPFALFLVIAASLFSREIAPLEPILRTWWFPVHVMLAILGNAFFALAFLTGIMYLIQEHYLKSRKVRGLYFLLPSLEVLDELNYRCLTYGFPLLTLGIITGALWSEAAIGTYWLWEPRQIWSLITWFLYAALLHGRLTSGWRGRRAALFSAGAFLVLIGSFLILNLTLGGGHGLMEGLP
jgi:cytochrome c-type biogenesis protein CcsB